MINNNIEDFKYVVFDLETTGLDPMKEQIIEIAAKKIDSKGNEISTFHQFVNLYKVEKIDPFIKNLTKIDEDLLEQEGEDISEVMFEFLNFIEESILVAQNTPFDMGFLIAYYLNENNISFGRANLDTINLAKYIYPNEPSYKLSELVKMFDVEYDLNAHHRADYDVKITAEVLTKQFEMLKEKNITTFKELLTCNNFRCASEKQTSFLTSLMGKNNHFFHPYDLYSSQIASKHIDYYLNKK